jgi:hypothetical protein
MQGDSGGGNNDFPPRKIEYRVQVKYLSKQNKPAPNLSEKNGWKKRRYATADDVNPTVA